MLHALAAESSTRPVYWIHGARSQTEDAFATEVARLLTTLPACPVGDLLQLALVYASARSTRRDVRARSTPPVVERLGVPADADVYLCGPTAFMADMTAAFDALGFAPTHVRTETFGTLGAITPGVVSSRTGPPRLPDGPPGTGPAVTFGRSGLTRAGTIATARCSSWPRRVASRSAGPAARACATPARPASFPVTWPTSRSPWTGRRRGTCSSAVPGPAATSSSISRADRRVGRAERRRAEWSRGGRTPRLRAGHGGRSAVELDERVDVGRPPEVLEPGARAVRHADLVLAVEAAAPAEGERPA